MQSNDMCILGGTSFKDPEEGDFNPMSINKKDMALNN